MVMLIGAIAWIFFVVLNYITLKNMIIKDGYGWTKGDRRMNILISLIGPIGFFWGLFTYLLRSIDCNDEPAKW